MSKTSTKGLSLTPALSYGRSAAITTIEPTKSTSRRSTVERSARGMLRAGSLVSPAATPTISAPLKA